MSLAIDARRAKAELVAAADGQSNAGEGGDQWDNAERREGEDPA